MMVGIITGTVVIIVLIISLFIAILILSAKAEKKQHGCLINIIVWVSAAILVLGGFGLFWKEPANLNDVELDYNISISDFGVKCNITPQRNIKKLELKFDFYDYKGNHIYTLKKPVGDVKIEQTYTVTISLFEIQSASIPITNTVSISKGYINIFSYISEFFHDLKERF